MWRCVSSGNVVFACGDSTEVLDEKPFRRISKHYRCELAQLLRHALAGAGTYGPKKLRKAVEKQLKPGTRAEKAQLKRRLGAAAKSISRR